MGYRGMLGGLGWLVWLGASLAHAGEREAEIMAGFAEDRFETIVYAVRRGNPPDEATARVEQHARDRARALWESVRQLQTRHTYDRADDHVDQLADDPALRLPEVLPVPRIEVRILPDQVIPMAIFGRGKILVDKDYAESLSADALDAALAHELAHLALGHAFRRLALGMAVMGETTPARIDERVRLALRLAASPVESHIMEREADELALQVLRTAGVRETALEDALRALMPYSMPDHWLSQMMPRINRVKQMSEKR